MHDLERYLSIRSASGPSLSHDGETLSFLYDTTGVAEVWSLTEPRTWPRQHTVGGETVRYCTHSPTRSTLVFGRDEGGDERVQLFALEPGSGTVTPLTATPDAKHYWGGWATAGDQFAFTSNRREESVFDVYVQSLDERGDEASMVFEGDGLLAPAGFDPTDERLLLVEAHSSSDQDLSIIDIASGTRTRLTDHDEPVRYVSPTWGPDGEAVYAATDRDRDTLSLVRIDIESGEHDMVVSGGDWNVDSVSIDQDSGRIVYTRNVDGYTEVRSGNVTDSPTIDTDPEPDLPDGVAGGISFGPDGERIAIGVSSRTAPTNVYVIDAPSGEVTRWTDAGTAGIDPGSFRAPELVHVESFDDLEVPGFLTLPETVPDGGAPVIVDIHGGPESQRRPSFAGLQQYFLANGYAVFEPNVRGSSGYGKRYTHLDDVERRMDSVADLEACAAWLAAQPTIDKDGLVAMGGSYGGFMVLAALTTYPDRWAAGVDIVGIANFVTFLENTGPWRREHREAEYGSLATDREFLTEISPVNNIDRIRAPLFVIHGENDPRVPVGEAKQIADAAAEHVPVETLLFPDEGHGIAKLENRISAYSEVVSFLNEHV